MVDYKKELTDLNKKLDGILYWIELIGKREARDLLLTILKDPKEIVLYQYSDGSNGYSELKKIAKMTETTIKDYWEKWHKMEILDMKPVQRGERGRRKYNLLEFGIDIPKIE
jgi:hypothetical protein